MATVHKCDFTSLPYYSILARHSKRERKKKKKGNLICPLLLAAERWSGTEWNRHSSFLQAHKGAAKSLIHATNLLLCLPPEDRNCGFSPCPAKAHLPQTVRSPCAHSFPSSWTQTCRQMVSCRGGIYQRVILRQITFMQRKFSPVGQRHNPTRAVALENYRKTSESHKI